MFFVQMSGYPGSGKSTLAKMIARHTGAVVIDHDVVKTALLGFVDPTAPQEAASSSILDPQITGRLAYHIDWSLVDFQLSQGHSVIMDSPCLLPVMLEKGAELALKHAAIYKYVECFLGDLEETNRRLQSRQRMPSQISQLSPLTSAYLTIDTSKSQRPADAPYLIVDTLQSPDSYLDGC